MLPDKKISVILPTYNEKENVLSLIPLIDNELGEYNHEIIVVDDNSPDGTFGSVLDKSFPYAKVICRKENKGLAHSIRCGLENASGDIFIVMDSDFNHPPEYLSFLIQSLSFCDCVSASRFMRKPQGASLRHRLSSLFNIFVRFMTGSRVRDHLYGFFAVKKEALEKCPYDDIFWGFGDYYIRLLYYLQKNKVSILEIPAVSGERKNGRGNRSFLKVFLQYTKETLYLSRKGRIDSYV
jgi:dolichol-phosphate mannosyltransferase